MANIEFFGLPLNIGAPNYGTLMGPDALRAGHIGQVLADLGHNFIDHGNLPPQDTAARWIDQIWHLESKMSHASVPIFAGGDHLLAAGTLPLMAKQARAMGRPLFVLWLDAHPDFHNPNTSTSGNQHGMPMAYACGEPGFDGHFPPLPVAIPQDQVMMLGLRSVDPQERQRLAQTGFDLCDMRRVDEEGLVRPLGAFLDRVAAAGGHLHLSLDLDFIDPAVAPGVGTPVPGGATLREAHLIMELVHERGLMTSLDLVELNPYLDHAGMSARLLVELTASLLGRRILEA